jgi:hypothetical protein
MAAGFLALVLPLAVASPGSVVLVPMIVAGLVVTCSWAAFLAAAVGLLVGAPHGVAIAAWVGLGGFAVLLALGWRSGHRWLAGWTTRGDTLDTAWARWRMWGVLWAIWRRWPVWLVGRGFGRTPGDLAYSGSLWPERGWHRAGHAHNELVEWVYETGVPGLVAVGFLAWAVVPRMAWGDPWSGLIAAGAVLMLGTYAARVVPVGGTWWIACALVAGR